MAKQKPKGQNQGKTISPSDQEAIRQLYAVYGNKREVARKMGVCEKTVHTILGAISDAEHDKARAESALETAGRVQAVVHRVIDKVDDSKIERASLPQAFVAIGIGIDKIERLQLHAKALRNQDGHSGLLTPQSINALISSVKGQVNQLTVLGIRIEQQSPELAERLQEAMLIAEAGETDAEIVETVETEPAPPLDFYNAPLIDSAGLRDEDEAVD
jgi:hypothetical protein